MGYGAPQSASTRSTDMRVDMHVDLCARCVSTFAWMRIRNLASVGLGAILGGHMDVGMFVEMCVGMREGTVTDMRVDTSADTRVGMRVDMRVDVRVDMCADPRKDICIGMRTDVCVDKRMDMCIDMYVHRASL